MRTSMRQVVSGPAPRHGGRRRLFGSGRIRGRGGGRLPLCGGLPAVFAATAGSRRGVARRRGYARFIEAAEPAQESLDIHVRLSAVREGIDDGLAEVEPPEENVAQRGIVLPPSFPHLGQRGFEGVAHLLQDIESDEPRGTLQGVDGAEHAVQLLRVLVVLLEGQEAFLPLPSWSLASSLKIARYSGLTSMQMSPSCLYAACRIMSRRACLPPSWSPGASLFPPRRC